MRVPTPDEVVELVRTAEPGYTNAHALARTFDPDCQNPALLAKQITNIALNDDRLVVTRGGIRLR